MEANFIKHPGGSFVPASDEDKEFADKIGAGEVVKFKFTKMRNYQFFKKWHSLVRLAFDYWEPPELPEDPEKRWMKKITPEKNYERFRKDLTIRAGYYDATFRLDGTVRIEADSIAWGSMTEETFKKLYSATINVVLAQIYLWDTEEAEDQTPAEWLESLVDQVMAYAA